jgi:hypothetical protein
MRAHAVTTINKSLGVFFKVTLTQRKVWVFFFNWLQCSPKATHFFFNIYNVKDNFLITFKGMNRHAI